MRIGDGNQPTPRPATGRTEAPAPAAVAPRVASDTLALKGRAPGTAPVAAPVEENPYDTSAGRKAADATSIASSTVDGVRSARPAIGVLRATAEAGEVGRFGGLLGKLANWGDEAFRFFGAVGAKVPFLAAAMGRFASVAPLLGVAVAGLDVAKAVHERDPEKKMKAEGMAVISVAGAAAGLVGAGAALGVAALAPLAVPAMVVGVGLAVLGIADQLVLGGAVSKSISRGMRAIAGWFR